MIFGEDFLTAGGKGKYFLFSIWISICRNWTCEHFENRSKINVFYDGQNDFALSGEIIHDHKFSFYAIVLT